MSSDFKIDVKSAIADFEKYDSKTQKAMQNTLTKSAIGMSRLQHSILKARVKKWTGKLGSSISMKKTGANSYEIGPDKNRVIYAAYIEFGEGSFAGYHYIKRAFNYIAPKFIKALQKDIKSAR